MAERNYFICSGSFAFQSSTAPDIPCYGKITSTAACHNNISIGLNSYRLSNIVFLKLVVVLPSLLKVLSESHLNYILLLQNLRLTNNLIKAGCTEQMRPVEDSSCELLP